MSGGLKLEGGVTPDCCFDVLLGTLSVSVASDKSVDCCPVHRELQALKVNLRILPIYWIIPVVMRAKRKLGCTMEVQLRLFGYGPFSVEKIKHH